MTKPRALDLFCCAGGASRGLQTAGFHVTGVDIRPQPRYCGDEFYQADALTFPLEGFDFIWASPPCQAYTAARHLKGNDHPELIEPVRARLAAAGVPYVIENVPGAPLIDPMTLCGLSFGLNVKRHRIFEANFFCLVPPCPTGHPGDWLIVFGWTALRRSQGQGTGPKKDRGKSRGKSVSHQEAGQAMGIDWMDKFELAQSIPPAYAEHLGIQALTLITDTPTARRSAASERLLTPSPTPDTPRTPRAALSGTL